MTTNFVKSACLAAIFLAHTVLAQAAIRLDDPIPLGPQVKVGKLANGLTWYAQKNARPEKKLELRLVVKAGSILEDEDQQGLAHFVEHMAFNGSAHFKKHELVSYLQSIDVKFGADLNAYTSFDETVYILPLPTDDPKNLDKAMTVLSDWAGRLTLNAADIDKERDIILEELRLGKGAADRMNKVLLPKLFNGSKYAQRLPIGKEEIIRQFKPATLRRFYHDWYRPDLMAVVMVGDIEPAAAEQLVRTHFGSLANPPHERTRAYAPIAQRERTESLVVTDKEAASNSVLIRYGLQDARYKSNFREYREQLVESLFTTMLNQRLQELSQLPAPPFLVGASSMDRLTVRYKSYNAFAALGKGGATPAIDALVQENERARQFGFAAAELERAKKDLMRNYERAFNERAKTDSATYVGEYVRNFLEQESIPGIENEYRYVQELVPGIKLDEVNAFARKTIPAKAAKLVVYMGSNAADTPPPAGEQLLGAVAAAENAPVSAHTEKTLASSLMDKPPAAGSIVAESEDQALGLTKLTLSNGVKVILKPTDFRNDQVLLSATRFGGQSLFDDKDIVNARYASAVVTSMGLKDYSPLDTQKILAGRAASVSLNLGGLTDNISGSAGGSDIETLLQLVYLKFAGVRRDEDLYQSFVGKQIEGARHLAAQPESAFRDTLIATLYNNNPRVGRTPRPEDFAHLSLDRSIDIYRQRFASAKDFTFIMVGSFELAAVKPLIATYLASLPTPDLAVGYRDVGIRPATGVVKKEVRSGSEAKSTISITFTGAAPFSEAAQLRLNVLMEVMNIRITDVLREKLGLIYGGGMGGGLSRVPYENYTINVSLPTGPEKVDKVIAATFAEIARMKEQGPDVADLDKVKQHALQSHQKSLRENSYWLGRLQSALNDGTDPASILTVNKDVAALTPDDMREAARRYFNTDNYVQVVLYPEK